MAFIILKALLDSMNTNSIIDARMKLTTIVMLMLALFLSIVLVDGQSCLGSESFSGEVPNDYCLLSETRSGYDLGVSTTISTDPGKCTATLHWNDDGDDSVAERFDDMISDANCRGDNGDTIRTSDSHEEDDTFQLSVGYSNIVCPAFNGTNGADGNTFQRDKFVFHSEFHVEDGEIPQVRGCPADDIVIEVEMDATTCFYSPGRGDKVGQLVISDNCGIQGGDITKHRHSTSTNAYSKAMIQDILVDIYISEGDTETITYGFYDQIGFENGCDDDEDHCVTCEVSVRAIDVTKPQITCPQNQYLEADSTGELCASASFDLPLPVAIWDNCGQVDDGLTLTMDPDLSVPSTFDVGTTTITYTVEDDAGNQASCNFDVIVTDNTPPLAICPDSMVGADSCIRADDIGQAFNNDNGVCGAIVNYGETTFEDNCGDENGVCESFSIESGTFFPVSGLPGGPTGPIPVTYMVTDRAGLSDNCTFLVEVFDTEDPVIEVCPPDVTVPNEPGLCSAVVESCPIRVRDNCPGELTITTTGVTDSEVCQDFTGVPIEIGTQLPVGVTTVTYEVTDMFGNNATCEQIITVEDREAPVFAVTGNDGGCPADIRLPATENCGRFVSYVVPYAIDNCNDNDAFGGETSLDVERVAGPGPGEFFPYGRTEVRYQISDRVDNIAECSFTVEIYDGEELVQSQIDCDTSGIVTMGEETSFTPHYDEKENGCPTTTEILCATCQLCSYEGAAYDLTASSDCEVNVDSNLVTISQSGDIGNFITVPVQVTDLEGRSISASCTVCIDSPPNPTRHRLIEDDERNVIETPSRTRGGRSRGGRGVSGETKTGQNRTLKNDGKGGDGYCDTPVPNSIEFLGSMSQCSYGKGNGKGKGGKGNYEWSCPTDWDPLSNDFVCRSACV